MVVRSDMRRRATTLMKVTGAVLLIALFSGAAYERVEQARDRERLPQIGRSVAVGDRTLNLFCSGAGSPAVIFDSGAGDPGFVWSGIQPEIAKLTLACWFDRAGEGFAPFWED